MEILELIIMMNLSTKFLSHKPLAVLMTSLLVMMLLSQRLCGVGQVDPATISTFTMQMTLQVLSGTRLVIVNSVQVEDSTFLQLRIRCPKDHCKLCVQILCMRLRLRAQLVARLADSMTRMTW